MGDVLRSGFPLLAYRLAASGGSLLTSGSVLGSIKVITWQCIRTGICCQGHCAGSKVRPAIICGKAVACLG